MRRDGSVAYYAYNDENHTAQSVSVLPREELAGTVFDLQINSSTGGELLVEKPDGQVFLTKADPPGAYLGFMVLTNHTAIYVGPKVILSEAPTSFRVFDSGGSYAINATGDLVSSNGTVIQSGVLRV